MKSRTSSVIGSVLSPLLIALLLQGCGAPPGEGVCGDEIVDVSEQCDDGNQDDGDGCDADCQLEGEDVCGDEIVSASEQCDDGNQDNGDGCDEDCQLEDGELSQAEQIDEFIFGLDGVPTEEQSTIPNTEPATEITDDGNYSCTTQNFTQTTPVQELSILQSATKDLFPGALLAGNSLYNGQFAQVGVDRAPLTYSLDIQDGTDASRSETMNPASLSQFQDTLGVILAEAELANATIDLDAKITEVRSEQELEIVAGFNLDTALVDVAGQFDFNNQETLSHFLVTIDAVYFTASIDLPANPSDLFADSVTLAEVQQRVGPGNPPVYVSSITYGTRFYLAVESSLAAQEVNAALQAAFDGGVVDANADIAISTRDVLENSTFSVVAVGAAGAQLDALSAAFSAAPEDIFDELRSFSLSSAVFSADFIGEPLTFTMKQLSDNAIVDIAFSGSFDALSCDRISQNIQVTLKEISVVGGQDGAGGLDPIQLAGTISAEGITSGTIFSQLGTQSISLSDGQGGSFVSNGAQFQDIVRIDPRNNNAEVTITADLVEDDGANGDDVLPLASLNINQNSTGNDQGGLLQGEGFSGEYELFLPTTSGDLTILVELRPVP